MGRVAQPLLLPVAIFIATLATRLPFATQYLWAWDSVLYARALERGFHVGFDLAEQRPHAPGYFLYVSAANVFRMFVGDSNAALVLVSMLASAAGATAIYLLARRFARTTIALIVAAAYAANPLVWLYSEVAYPYTLLGLLSVILAGIFWQARSVWLPSLLFGVVAGFRQDLLPLLGPLWLWSILRPQAPLRPQASQRPASSREGTWRERSIAAIVLAAGALIWLVPTTLLSGGLVAYADALIRQTGSIGETYSVPAHGLDALWANLRFTALSLAWGLFALAPVALALAGAWAIRWVRSGRTVPRPGQAQTFFALWIVPGLVVFVLVHIGEWGQILSILPALYVATAAAMERAARGASRVPAAPWRLAGAALLALPMLVFLTSGERFSAAALARHDTALAVRIAEVRASFPPERTTILAREDFLLVRHYLPEYKAWLYDPEPHSRNAVKRKRTTQLTAIVIFTDGLRPRQALDVREIELRDGVRLSYIPIEPGTVIELYGERYTVREPGAVR